MGFGVTLSGGKTMIACLDVTYNQSVRYLGIRRLSHSLSRTLKRQDPMMSKCSGSMRRSFRSTKFLVHKNEAQSFFEYLFTFESN